jgi:MFS-type transporter involved in bile tolerance (Atg22 family)
LGSRLLKKPDWLDHQTAVGLTFAVKTFAASLLALYIAFWAGLDDPRWSFLTVFVVSQPDSGLVLAKGVCSTPQPGWHFCDMAGERTKAALAR